MGAVAWRSAVLVTDPLLMSPWLRVAGGAGRFRRERGSLPAGQVTVTQGSVTVTPVRVTLPVFSTSKV